METKKQYFKRLQDETRKHNRGLLRTTGLSYGLRKLSIPRQPKTNEMKHPLYNFYLDWNSKCEPEQQTSFQTYLDQLFAEIETLSPEKRESLNKLIKPSK